MFLLREVNRCLVVQLECPRALVSLRMPGNGLPRQCEHWLAMTEKIFLFAPKINALCNENCVIANQPAGWCGNPFPAMRSIASAVGRRFYAYKLPVNKTSRREFRRDIGKLTLRSGRCERCPAGSCPQRWERPSSGPVRTCSWGR